MVIFQKTEKISKKKLVACYLIRVWVSPIWTFYEAVFWETGKAGIFRANENVDLKNGLYKLIPKSKSSEKCRNFFHDLKNYFIKKLLYRKWSLLRLSVNAYLWRLASHSEPAIQNVTTQTTGRRGQKGAVGIIFDIAFWKAKVTLNQPKMWI